MVKRALQTGMVVMGCLIGQETWATQTHVVVLSGSTCQPERFDHSVMVCKFVYEVPPLSSDKIRIKAINNHHFEAEDGKLKFSVNNNPNIIGKLTINDGEVTQLTETFQEIDTANRQKPLKLELEYWIGSEHIGRFKIPQMMPMEFDVGQGVKNQIVFTDFEVIRPVSCAFQQNSQNISLRNIETNDIRNKGDSVQAGNFKVEVSCNSENAHVVMAFKDANNSQNHNILSTKQDNKAAQGIGLQIKHRDHDKGFVTFSPEPADIMTPHQYQWQMKGVGKTYESAFDVYYVNTGDIVTAGKVEGKVIATIAFK